MTAWLISALERLPALARRVVIAVVSLFLVGAAVTVLTVAPSPGVGGRPGPRAQRAPVLETASRPLPQLLAPSVLPVLPVLPVLAAQLHRAREAAGRFLSNYLPLAYGRASSLETNAVRAALGRRFAGERALITPVERRRHPRVVSLRVVGTTPGFVVATAMVDDGGLSVYLLRFTLREGVGHRWAVRGVLEG